MRRLGGGLIALLVWPAVSVLPVVALPTEACAAEGPRAALVVDTGENVHTYCVALPDDQVTGLELISLAGEQHALSYRFGYGGEAVCMLADVGTNGDDCFERYPDFWGYWRGSDGGWTWSSTGAGSTTVTNGDVEGWSWGSGSDGSSHPRPPETAFSSVCPVAAEPDDQTAPTKRSGNQPNRPQNSGPRPGAAPGAPEAASPGSDHPSPRQKPEAPGEKKKEKKKRTGRDDRKTSETSSHARPSPNPSPDTVLASDDITTPREDGKSVPATGWVALTLAGALGAGGFAIARRRRGSA